MTAAMKPRDLRYDAPRIQQLLETVGGQADNARRLAKTPVERALADAVKKLAVVNAALFWRLIRLEVPTPNVCHSCGCTEDEACPEGCC